MSLIARFGGGGDSKSEYKDKDKPTQIRYSNITAAKGNTRQSNIVTRKSLNDSFTFKQNLWAYTVHT